MTFTDTCFSSIIRFIPRLRPVIIVKGLHRSIGEAVPTGIAPVGTAFLCFPQVIMISPVRILNPILFALAVLLAGCPTPPRPDREGLPAVSFSITAPDARIIAVAGSFNRWDPSGHPLSGPDRTGKWTATLRLPPGRYEYLFVINGDSWVLDPAAPSVENGLGERNSIVTVPGGQDGKK